MEIMSTTDGPIDMDIDMEIDCSDNSSVIKPVEGRFYRVNYTFQSKKKNEVTKVLPAMCEKNDIEEHCFVFLKPVESEKGYIYTLDISDKQWIHEDDVIEMLPVPDMTRRGQGYAFMEKL